MILLSRGVVRGAVLVLVLVLVGVSSDVLVVVAVADADEEEEQVLMQRSRLQIPARYTALDRRTDCIRRSIGIAGSVYG
jgi:hypothetical protein